MTEFGQYAVVQFMLFKVSIITPN